MAGRKKGDQETLVAVGGTGLLASILTNLKQHGDNDRLIRSVDALQRLVQDWQQAHHNLDAQLALALRTNEEQTRLITSLRGELREIQGRAYAAEQRALEAEAALDDLRRSADAASTGETPST